LQSPHAIREHCFDIFPGVNAEDFQAEYGSLEEFPRPRAAFAIEHFVRKSPRLNFTFRATFRKIHSRATEKGAEGSRTGRPEAAHPVGSIVPLRDGRGTHARLRH